MLKIIWSMKYREDVGPDDGLRHYREVHGPIVAAIPGVVKYVQNVPTETMAHGFDGISELWFQDREAYDAATDTPQWQAANADAAEFMNLAEVGAAIVEEVTVTGP